jgi:ribosome hibernation promoting factor
MNINVTFRHLPSSDALRDHAREKVEKFKTYLVEPMEIHIVLRVEKIRQIAEININSKNYRAHAIEESQDMYTSIDKVVSKAFAQVRRHKERVKDHKMDARSVLATGTPPA